MTIIVFLFFFNFFQKCAKLRDNLSERTSEVEELRQQVDAYEKENESLTVRVGQVEGQLKDASEEADRYKNKLQLSLSEIEVCSLSRIFISMLCGVTFTRFQNCVIFSYLSKHFEDQL